MKPPTPQQLQDVTVRLRDLDARYNATPRGAPGRYDLGADLHRTRVQWRQMMTAAGLRTPGMAVGGHGVPSRELAKINSLLRGYTAAGRRNTGRPVSTDIAEFERRVEQRYGGRAVI